MRKGSARSSGLKPTDQLTKSGRSNNSTCPSRYNVKPRVDPLFQEKMREELLSSSSMSYVPKISPISARGTTIPTKRRISSSETSDEDNLETVRSSTDQVHRKRDKGFETIKTQGTFYAIHQSGDRTVRQHAVLIIEKDEDLIMKIRWNGAKIEGSEVNFMTEGRHVFFSSNGNFLGVVLKYGRIIGLRSQIQTQVFLWKGDDRPGFKELKDSLEEAMISVVVLKKENLTLKTVLRAVQEKIPEQSLTQGNTSGEVNVSDLHPDTRENRHFENKILRSLHKSTHKSCSRETGTVIGIPNSADFRGSHVISTKNFYADGPSQGGLLNHSLSHTKRITRSSSETPPVTAATSEELDTPEEVPQLFKPTLFYRFDDNTTLSISNQDFKCLYNHDWINDSILDFFVKFWTESSINSEIVSRNQIHVLSSFFYTKLVSKPESYYDNVKKWVRDTDLFTKDYVVMPINESFHWFGCIISNLPALLSFLKMERDFKLKHSSDTNAESNDDLSVTSPIVTIMVYDSLRQTHSRETDPIKEFLIAYAADKYELEVFKHQIKMKTCMVPQQPNMSDCGVHVIFNTKTFFENPERTTQLWHESKFKSKNAARVVNEYFDKKGRTNARQELRSVLLDLQKRQVELKKNSGNSALSEQDRSASEDDDGHSDVEILENYTEPFLKDKNGNKNQIENEIEHGNEFENDNENENENVNENEKRIGNSPLPARQTSDGSGSDLIKDTSAEEREICARQEGDRSNSLLSGGSERSSKSETVSPTENGPPHEVKHHKKQSINSLERSFNTTPDFNNTSRVNAGLDDELQVSLSPKESDLNNLITSSQNETLEIAEEPVLTELPPTESRFFKKKDGKQNLATSDKRLSMPQKFEFMKLDEGSSFPGNFSSDEPIEITNPAPVNDYRRSPTTASSTDSAIVVEDISKTARLNHPRTPNFKLISSPSRYSSNGSKLLNTFSRSKIKAAQAHNGGSAMSDHANISDEETESIRFTGERSL
ncbi:SUMO protease ULP2 LALA0_S01e15148g [Lachancea lanzarotensis]|uniref:LALA0S01e15148g1_1 n=1 Tax=Lachancea lanzarotensis TaxID=1245769 RepID=A0A0C7MTG7_9SACH|nr:uncharacterized protein LALA0_S01e15148g [Lachancea lanzarotensis]CEP60621.1 LALA0S01e15148g1_1 [Lachancea lanzarotensis]